MSAPPYTTGRVGGRLAGRCRRLDDPLVAPAARYTTPDAEAVFP
ncbi:hypothetical protein ACO0M4_25585 [Streptomyces sp. RGM 3693]